MSTGEHRAASSLPPHLQLVQMALGFIPQRLLSAAAKLDIPDHLAAAPQTAAALASTLDLHAPSLHRMLRTLAQLGVVTEREGGRFALTALGEAMRRDAPGRARASLLLFGSEWTTGSWDNLLHCLQTGDTGMRKAFGMDLFTYLSTRPDSASVFNAAMVGFHGDEPPAVAQAYDFSVHGTLVDVGGGTGNLLSTILARHAGPRGVLFDRAPVIEEAPALFRERGVLDRVRFEAGDFFESVPPGGDAYLLSHIIHDWNEEQCQLILGNCRRAMKPGARLLIVEMVLPEGDAPHPGKISDMLVMVVAGGQERTAREYGAMLERAGFSLDRVVPTRSAVSVVEARPA